MREMQQKPKQPTGYDRLCRRQDPRGARRAARVLRDAGRADAHPRRRRRCSFDDLIRGQVSAPRPDDQVILKADGFPTYHLAVVVDDHEMGITHVVRGEEWISRTPKHILLYRWLGLEPPKFAHMPLLRNTDKSKISKRKNPAARLTWFREQGYLPEALRELPCAACLSAAAGAERRGRRGLHLRGVQRATSTGRKVNPVGPIFDLKKLDWLNGVYIRELDGRRARLAGCCPTSSATASCRRQPSRSASSPGSSQVTELIQTRMALLTEAAALVAPVLRRRRRRS